MNVFVQKKHTFTRIIKKHVEFAPANIFRGFFSGVKSWFLIFIVFFWNLCSKEEASDLLDLASHTHFIGMK